MSDARAAMTAARKAQDAWEALHALPVALGDPEALAATAAALLAVAGAAERAAWAFGALRRALTGCQACAGTGRKPLGACPHCLGTGDPPGPGHLGVCRPCRLAMEGRP